MVEVGQIWIDKDRRMNGRAVKIVKIDADNGWVRYSQCNPTSGWVSDLTYRAMLKRFPKAFTPYTPPDGFSSPNERSE